MLYYVDLVSARGRLRSQKETRSFGVSISEKRLRVNVRETEIIIDSEKTAEAAEDGKFPCGVRTKSVSRKYILFKF